ncbi:MAG: hypothetical protein RI549_05970 [Wenzhouxiangella sp.]|nr:hypothetical protein [Wenzhouxiangella sp.]
MPTQWPRLSRRSRRSAPVVAIDWRDDGWLAGWIDPIDHQRHHLSRPMAPDDAVDDAIDDANGPQLEWAGSVGRWLRDHIGPIQGVVMALPASVVWHAWVPEPAEFNDTDATAMAASFPQAWRDAGWTLTPWGADPHCVDVGPSHDPRQQGVGATTTEVGQWWVAAEPGVVARYQAFARRAGVSLLRLDVRAAVLARAVQRRHSGDWPVVLVDCHRGQTQWLVVDHNGVRGVQSFAHRRLSAAEHADHLAAQLQPVVGQHGIQACVPTGEPFDRLDEVAALLGVALVRACGVITTDAGGVLACTAGVDGLVDGLVNSGGVRVNGI